MSVDPRAATGFTIADTYEFGRPSYPQEAVASLADAFGLGSTSTVLDLAAGTGKLTQVLLPFAGRVIAVDPSEAMLGKLRERFPALDARGGTAEEIPLADASVQAVFCAQAFHWFRAAEAAQEIARVLRPGGGLALLWNRADWELPWHDEFLALTEPLREAAGPTPSDYGAWQPELERSGMFAPVSTTTFEHEQRVSVEQFVALVTSWSWIANLPDAERTAVLTRVRELAGDSEPLALRYRTDVHATRRR